MSRRTIAHCLLCAGSAPETSSSQPAWPTSSVTPRFALQCVLDRLIEVLPSPPHAEQGSRRTRTDVRVVVVTGLAEDGRYGVGITRNPPDRHSCTDSHFAGLVGQCLDQCGDGHVSANRSLVLSSRLPSTQITEEPKSLG